MAVQPAEVTQLMGIPIPGEDSDPYMEQFRAYTLSIEDGLFFPKMMKNMFISGGGTRIWSSSTSIFSWSADWIIPVFHWGKKITVPFGPDGVTRAASVPNGSCLVVDVPAILSTNVTTNFRVVAQLNPAVNSEWVVGWNNNGVLQLRDIGELT